MGAKPTREALEAEKERREFQFKMSGLFNKKVSGNAMDLSSLESIFGKKPIFNKGNITFKITISFYFMDGETFLSKKSNKNSFYFCL